MTRQKPSLLDLIKLIFNLEVFVAASSQHLLKVLRQTYKKTYCYVKIKVNLQYKRKDMS